MVDRLGNSECIFLRNSYALAKLLCVNECVNGSTTLLSKSQFHCVQFLWCKVYLDLFCVYGLLFYLMFILDIWHFVICMNLAQMMFSNWCDIVAILEKYQGRKIWHFVVWMNFAQIISNWCEIVAILNNIRGKKTVFVVSVILVGKLQFQ